jgi:PAS domain S-box-containing protein
MSELIDNRAQRVRTLKEIIMGLHAGEAPERVQARLRELVRQTEPSEIVAMEQQLMAEGMPVSQIQALCDLHSQVTREVLVQLAPREVPPGHPLDTFRRENAALREVLGRARAVLGRLRDLPEEASAEAERLELRRAVNELMDVDKHYQRKEHALFPRLERHGVTGPSKVMWAKDDEVRALLKSLEEALRAQAGRASELKALASGLGQRALAAVEEMIYKEENILLPLSLSTLTEEDWAEIWESSPRYGWCLVEPRTGYRPPAPARREGLKLPGAAAVELPTGALSLEQLAAIFNTLPVDLTFVDAEDRVAFFSEGPDRIFARSRAILGRKVQHCHPPKSVEVVDRILEDFRSGRQDVAEFWIRHQGRFVHIRYFAVRDGERRYLGTLEVTQDLTRLRALEGERRLLHYDEPVAAAPSA